MRIFMDKMGALTAKLVAGLEDVPMISASCRGPTGSGQRSEPVIRSESAAIMHAGKCTESASENRMGQTPKRPCWEPLILLSKN